MKKIIFAFYLFQILAIPSFAGDLYVDQKNTSGGNGSQANPFKLLVQPPKRPFGIRAMLDYTGGTPSQPVKTDNLISYEGASHFMPTGLEYSGLL